MKNANLTKAQREYVLKTWKVLDDILKENKFNTAEEDAEHLPDGYMVTKIKDDGPDDPCPYIVVVKLPWQFMLYRQPMIGYVIVQTDVFYWNIKTGEWEEPGHNGY